MSDDAFDTKFHIDNLNRSSGDLTQRLVKLESAFDALYGAVLELALRDNKLTGVVEAKLNQASAYRQP